MITCARLLTQRALYDIQWRPSSGSREDEQQSDVLSTTILIWTTRTIVYLLLPVQNMAGKSTYMRQSALIVLMAQIRKLLYRQNQPSIGIVDRIFTRVGASDDWPVDRVLLWWR